MNKEFKKLLNVFNSAYSQIGRKRLNKRYKNRRRRVVPMLSQKPQCMGLGTGTLFISFTYGHSGEVPLKQLTLQEMLNSSQELILKKNEFMYCKIQYIKAIIMPRNVTSGLAYMLLNWANNHSYTEDQIKNSDSTKLIPGFQIAPKTYTYFPPNMIVNTLTPHNLREYATTAIFSNYPGYFYFYGAFSFVVRFEIKIKFRGAQQFEIQNLSRDLNNFNIKDKEEKEIDGKRKEQENEEGKLKDEMKE